MSHMWRDVRRGLPLPVKNFTKRQHIVVCDDDGHTAKLHDVIQCSLAETVATRDKTECGVLE